MIEKNIKYKILKNAISLEKFGMNDLTWEKEEAKALITSLMGDDIGIFGGSVYKIDANHLIPLYDNWFCNFDEKESKLEFSIRSKRKALDYINNYPIYLGENIVFSIVFSEDID
jgi:hypothetical protein